MKRLLLLAALPLVACEATDVSGELPEMNPDIGPVQDMLPPPPEPDAAMRGMGQLGDDCQGGSDCATAICVPNANGEGQCSINCVPGEDNACPIGWYCDDGVSFDDPVCRPQARLDLCDPCTDDRQCGDALDLCLPLLNEPGLRACATDCSATPCPGGFTCQMVGAGQVCLPDDGTCPDLPEGDRDGDGVPDEEDRCPEQFGQGEDGCPTLPPDGEDADGDGVLDGQDACPNQAGNLPNGCPIGALDGQIVSGGGLLEVFGRGIWGHLGANPDTQPMSSPSYRIKPISIGVKP